LGVIEFSILAISISVLYLPIILSHDSLDSISPMSEVDEKQFQYNLLQAERVPW